MFPDTLSVAPWQTGFSVSVISGEIAATSTGSLEDRWLEVATFPLSKSPTAWDGSF